MAIEMYDAENVEFKFSRLRRHLNAVHVFLFPWQPRSSQIWSNQGTHMPIMNPEGDLAFMLKQSGDSRSWESSKKADIVQQVFI